MIITPAQCRMARAGLGWSARELAAAANVSPATVARFEANLAKPIPLTLDAIRRALEAAGVKFTAHGVELRGAATAS